MEFRVSRPTTGMRRADTVYLSATGWDDWFQFSTLYNVVYVRPDGEAQEIGQVKIGQFGLQGARASDPPRAGFRSADLPDSFTALTDNQFSLGQDTSYYEALNEIGPDFRDQYLAEMKDIAFDNDLFRRAEQEPVTKVSLLRDVPLATVRDQYARLARGGARLTPYQFQFRVSKEPDTPVLEFSVEPDSRPPTNIHVLIGRNGVGKSTVLNKFAHAIMSSSQDEGTDRLKPWEQLTNLVSVSFSAFDAFEPVSVPRDRTKLTYHYVGLKKIGTKVTDDVTSSTTKDHRALSAELTKAARSCLLGARRPRLTRAIRLLEGDPIFAAIGLGELMESGEADEIIESLPGIFRRFSSGHKIVLLTVTKLVETVEEKSLVLLDEPEAHLHPPLLSAFVRALSDLLTNRNGMAIVATHSPVVLQEAPRSCVWKLHRVGDVLGAERPELETFGENVGTLTDEVFGLEVTATGFHKMLADAALEASDYESAVESFNGQLGAEGRAILRTMMAHRRSYQHVEG